MRALASARSPEAKRAVALVEKVEVRMWRGRRIGSIAVVALAALSCQAERAPDPAEVEALRALDRAYAAEWMEGDADGVLALFTEDATLVPHHGDAPIKGQEAIRDFWFNPEYPPTVVPEWRREATEIFVSGDVGVVRGRALLVWEYEGTRTTIPEGNYVIVAVRREGVWRIRLMTWNDDPREWLQEPVGALDLLAPGDGGPLVSAPGSSAPRALSRQRAGR
jgi:uncharacterized protein (TIGR02246 family)